jgi:hypothetical protein
VQLEKSSYLRAALTAATCSLLGAAPVVRAAYDPVTTDTALLFYDEKDRVNVVEAAADVIVPRGGENTLTIKPTVDAISGATPNGASPTATPQTIGDVTTAPGELPLSSFSDQRLSLSLQWTDRVNRMDRSVTGLDLSAENDYHSLGASYQYLHDFNNKLTTVSAGLSASFDSIESSTGTIPDGLSVVSAHQIAGVTTAARATARPQAVTSSSGTVSGGLDTSSFRSKQDVDTLFGITQVVNRRTLMQLNYSLGASNGYLTDPYKIISRVGSVTGETDSYLTEKRPGFRLRQSLYWKTVVHLPEDVIHLTYRHYWDSWKVVSDTAELNYHYRVTNNGFYIEPLVRYYSQNAAYFYYYSLTDNIPLPKYASADYRLAKMDSTTYSIKLAMPLARDNEVSLRYSRMQQRGDSHPQDAIGVQNSLDMYPGLDAQTIQFNWDFKF